MALSTQRSSPPTQAHLPGSHPPPACRALGRASLSVLERPPTVLHPAAPPSPPHSLDQLLACDPAVQMLSQVLSTRGWSPFTSHRAIDAFALSATAAEPVPTSSSGWSFATNQLPIQRGIYIFLTVDHAFQHPLDEPTHILKIGAGAGAKGIRSRLGEQIGWARDTLAKHDPWERYSHFHWAARHGLVAAWSLDPQAQRASTAATEALLHEKFFETHLGYPVGSHQGR